jgi:hypothetical protein
VINAPERQRCGIYGTGKQMCAFMTNRQAMRLVTPARLAGREFHPADFVTGRGTLYSLSKEGKGSWAALVTALTVVAVTEAGEQLAKRSPLGRLPVPIVGVLDVAANVCRWRELPDLYSHYGSRGIVLSTILQSFAQGVEVRGRTGMEKLWSASTIKLYGGGGAEVEFLEQLSRLIGEYDLHTRTSTHSQGRHGRSISVSVRRERILDVSDLAALPRGRLIVLASGCRPTPAQPCHGCNLPDAHKVRESIEHHDPGATQSADNRRRKPPPAGRRARSRVRSDRRAR